MFIDFATVFVKAGSGGNGIVSFHRTRGDSKGGPDGGDGGNGGNIIFIASNNENTLANFRYQKELKAEDGIAGSSKKRHGRNGVDLEVKVPVGTQVQSEGRVLVDLTENGQRAVIARGGRGGYGNAHFTSSTRQAPRIAEKGEPGEEFELQLELKMIADIGLVGLPNAGKSTLLARISNARPEIADYAFTTLRPNLGVVKVDRSIELLFADIPGLIEGASTGKGLGGEFLRHIERTKVLIHLVDAYQDDVVAAYRTIQKELSDYRIDLSKKPQIICLNKIDGLDEEIITDIRSRLQKATKQKEIFAISASSGAGLQELLYAAAKLVQTERLREQRAKNDEIPVITIRGEPELPWVIEQEEDGVVVVRGREIERFAMRTDFDSDDGMVRLRDILRKKGVMRRLEDLEIQESTRIYFGDDRSRFLEY